MLPIMMRYIHNNMCTFFLLSGCTYEQAARFILRSFVGKYSLTRVDIFSAEACGSPKKKVIDSIGFHS